MTFHDENVGDQTQSGSSSIYKTMKTPPDVDLDNWFRRPREILTFSIAENANFTVDYHVAWLYFTLPPVAAKLDGYSRIRFKLHLKFMVNATPFQYGAYYVTFKPLCDYYGQSEEVGDFSGGTCTTNTLFLKSTRPNLLLDVCNKAGGEMSLPFVYYKEWLDLANNKSGATDVNESELLSYGMLSIDSLFPLTTASTAVGPNIEFTVYAWAEDVELDGPSVLQSMSVKSDKPCIPGTLSYGAKTVSTIATAMAPIHPLFGMLGRASQVVSDVAKYFGFTNPPLVTAVHAYRPDALPNLASPEISTQHEKLTLDPSNELSIDPTIAGGQSEDSLVVTSLVSRPTYLGVATWQVSTASNAQLFSSYVNPNFVEASPIYTAEPSTRDYRILSLSTLAGTCMYFDKWRGGITYKFKVFCSPFHSGRLRLSWDPAVMDQNSVSNYIGYVHTEIHDISPGKEFQFTVPYLSSYAWTHNDRQYLKSVNGSGYFPNYRFNNVPMSDAERGPANERYSNGIIKLDVLNTLSAPDTSANVYVGVWVCGSSDFEVSDPNSLPTGKGLEFGYYPTVGSYSTLQSHSSPGMASVFSGSQGTDISDNPLPDATSSDYKVYMGEPFRSIRQLLHRSFFTGVLTLGVQDGVSPSWKTFSTTIIAPRQPTIPGQFNLTNNTTVAYASGGGTSTGPFKFSPLTPLAFFTSAHVGWRGSMVKRVAATNSAIGQVDTVAIKRKSHIQTPQFIVTESSAQTQNVAADYYAREVPFGSESGQAVALARTGASVSAVLPMYTNKLMNPGNLTLRYSDRQTTLNALSFGRMDDNYDLTIQSSGRTNDILTYESAGPDFSVVQFLNFPEIHVLNASPLTA